MGHQRQHNTDRRNNGKVRIGISASIAPFRKINLIRKLKASSLRFKPEGFHDAKYPRVEMEVEQMEVRIFQDIRNDGKVRADKEKKRFFTFFTGSVERIVV